MKALLILLMLVGCSVKEVPITPNCNEVPTVSYGTVVDITEGFHKGQTGIITGYYYSVVLAKTCKPLVYVITLSSGKEILALNSNTELIE